MRIDTILSKINNTNQPIILILDFNSNPKLFLSKYILKLTNNDALTKIDDVSDLIIIDKQEKIKKDDIINLRYFCSYTSIDNKNKKFYYISNFDNCTKEAYNALLKFIEEPINNVYGIFCTSNIDKIPLTIRSRCQIYFLDQDYDFVSEIKKKYNLNNWVFNLFYDDKIIDFINTDLYIEFDKVINFLRNKNIQEYELILNIFKNWSYDQIQLFFKALLSISNFNKNITILELIERIYLNPPKLILLEKLIQIFWD